MRRLDLTLVAIVIGGFALAAYFALRATSWLVMTDELLFAKAAISAGAELALSPEVRHDPIDISNRLYPLLTAPIYLLFDMPDAFRATHLLNALLLASTAIPAYLLVRELALSKVAARTVAALSVLIPWLAYSMMIMTESLAYPAFAWAIYAIHRSLARPSAGHDLAAVAAIAIAIAARTQFVLLALALPVVLLVHELGYALAERRGTSIPRALAGGVHRMLLAHPVLLAVAVAAGSGLVYIELTKTLHAFFVDSGYKQTIEGSLLPPGAARGALAHFAYIAIGTGIAPAILALGWCLRSLLRPTDKSGHAFAVLAFVVIVAMAFQVTSFNVRFATLQVQDRYLFYIAPLLFAGMAAFVFEARWRWLAAISVLAAGGFVAWAVSVANFEHTLAELPRYASPDAVFHTVLNDLSEGMGRSLGVAGQDTAILLTGAAVAIALGVAAMLRFASSATLRQAVILPVLVFCAVETGYVLDQIQKTDASANWGVSETLQDRDFVDQTVPGSNAGDVAVVPARFGDDPFVETALWWDLEFWNKTIGRVYTFDGLEYDTLARVPLYIRDFDTGELAVGNALTGNERYLVVAAADTRFAFASKRTLTSRQRPPFTRVDVIEPQRPWRAAWATQGLFDNGWIQAGGEAVLRVYGEPGAGAGTRLRIHLRAPANARETRRFAISGAGMVARVHVKPRNSATAELSTTCVAAGSYEQFRIRATGATKLPDGRAVSLRIEAIEARSSRNACTVGPSR